MRIGTSTGDKLIDWKCLIIRADHPSKKNWNADDNWIIIYTTHFLVQCFALLLMLRYLDFLISWFWFDARQGHDGNMTTKDGCDQFCEIQAEHGFSCKGGTSADRSEICSCSCQCHVEVPAARQKALCTCQDDAQKNSAGLIPMVWKHQRKRSVALHPCEENKGNAKICCIRSSLARFMRRLPDARYVPCHFAWAIQMKLIILLDKWYVLNAFVGDPVLSESALICI